MTLTDVRVILSRTEFDYLCNAGFLESHQLDILRQAEQPDNDAVKLNLTLSVAEEFRGKFTEQLAKVGFDEKYEATPLGILLEELIDQFFVA